MYSPPRSDSELFFSPKSCNFLSFLTKNTSSIRSRVLLLQVVVAFRLEKCQACSFQSDLNSSSEITKRERTRMLKYESSARLSTGVAGHGNATSAGPAATSRPGPSAPLPEPMEQAQEGMCLGEPRLANQNQKVPSSVTNIRNELCVVKRELCAAEKFMP